MFNILADASRSRGSDGSSSDGAGSGRGSGGSVGRARLPAEEAVDPSPSSPASAAAGPGSPKVKARVARKETPTLQVRKRPQLATGAALQWQQLTALTRKNVTIRCRAWKTNLLLVLQAVLFMALIWVVDRAVSASRQRQPSFSRVEVAVPQPVGPVPTCDANLFMRAGQPCLTFLYAPAGDPGVEAVVQGVMARTEPPIPPSQVLGLANSSAIDAWLLANPEQALAAVLFTLPDNSSAAAAGLPSAASPDAFTAGSPGNGTGGSLTGLPLSSGANPSAGMMATGGGFPANGMVGFPAAGGNGSVPAEQLASFAAVPPAAAASRQLGFSIQTNSSVQWFKGKYQHPNTYIQLPLQVAVEREIARLFTGNASIEWDVSLAQFPHPTAKSPSMIGQFAPTFLFASIMFQFVLLVHDVVAEKEGRARQMMAVMGLRPLPFWASWVLFQGFLALVEACLLVGFGYAFGFRLFTHNAFGLSFLLLLLVCLAMTSFGFFVASFLSKASAAVPAGFLLFIVAWVVLIVIAFGFPFNSSVSTVAVAAFSTVPWALLSKGVQDLAAATEGRQPGISWADRFAYCQPEATLPPGVHLAGTYWKPSCVMPLGQMFSVLAVQAAGYMILAVFFDAVLPDANGVRRPPWFFLLPSYWRRSGRGGARAAAKALAAPTEAEGGLTLDPDVAQETARLRRRCAAYLSSRRADGHAVPAEAALELAAAELAAPSDLAAASQEAAAPGHSKEGDGGKLNPQQGKDLSAGAEQEQAGRPFAVEMFGLRKVYKRGNLLRRRKPFVAVRGNWLGVNHGECFCLLGPNGAGKSTTINCLTGVLPFDGGDALVCGESIASAGGMDRVRPLMGVCPQFDVLWEQLTGREHLMLFGAIKGLPAVHRKDDAARLLEDVRLTEAAGVRAGAYSGGMKRRLSVAMALLGDPQVVYLDEPTTGLDPISRRHLWDLVDRAKRDRAVVLTTHSMEEADILGDRIGIMARGRLRCIGTSLRLKARFGSGYRVSIRVMGSSQQEGGLQLAGSAMQLGGSSGGHRSAAAASSAPAECCEIEPADGASQQHTNPLFSGQPGSQAGSSRAVAAAAAQQEGKEGAHQRDPAAARQAAAVRALFWRELGIKPSDESLDYVHFLVPYESEDRLPALFSHLKAHQAALGVADIQLRLTPLEEVFLNVARKAELEHAQLEGHKEALRLEEEGVAVQVPIGAEFIQSPAGHLYHIRWGQDPDSGELKLQDYWKDPLSTAASASANVGAAGAGGPAAAGAADV